MSENPPTDPVTPVAPSDVPPAPADTPTDTATPSPLHDDPAIAKALEGLTDQQRETLLTTGGRNALAARLQEAKEAKAQAATAADTARSELAQTIGKALGLVKDEPVDPAKLTEQLTAKDAEARQAKVELAIFRAAQAANADPNALLDSRSFMNKVATIDPSDGLAVAAAIGDAIAANSAFVKAQGPRVPAPNPAQGSSAFGGPDLKTQIDTAQKAGDWKEVIRLENQKLRPPQS